MIRIDILTTTRAEYGLLRPLIRNMAKDAWFDMRILVSGTHLSESFGMTCQEIEKDNFGEFLKLPILSEKKGTIGVAETMANAIIRFAGLFEKDKPDFLLVDGDRYETAAVCIAALNANIPIIHLGGGATTEGAVDENFRHMITKMSWLHFPTAEVYRQRIIRMGEEPDRVYTVGSLGLENIKNETLLEKDELEKSIGFLLDKPYAVVTFHPVTKEDGTAEQQMMELLNACETSVDMKFVFTKANADCEGDKINALLDQYANKHSKQCICVASLGVVKYLSALKYCAFVMGNSSSGIIEAPSFGIPTINIGDRQKGRLQADSVLNCKPEKQELLKTMQLAMSQEIRLKCHNTINPFGDGNVSQKIIRVIKEKCSGGGDFLKKKFYDA